MPRMPATTGRLTLVILAGPFIGTIVYALTVLVSAWPAPWDDVVAIGLVILVFGWPLGTAGSMLSAIVVKIFGLAARQPRRAIEALLLGALTGPLGVAIMVPVLGIPHPPLYVFATIALCGAVALALTTLSFRQGLG